MDRFSRSAMKTLDDELVASGAYNKVCVQLRGSMPTALPRDATIRDVLASLSNPESFVRQVVGVMHEAAREHGEIVVRLGITGTGKAPNYRVESATSGVPLIALDGANHQRWPDGENFSAANNWSSAAMTKDEVAKLLGEIRGRPGLRRGAKT